MAASSSPAARGPFIAPLPPFEVCYAVIVDAEWLRSRVQMLKYDHHFVNRSDKIVVQFHNGIIDAKCYN